MAAFLLSTAQSLKDSLAALSGARSSALTSNGASFAKKSPAPSWLQTRLWSAPMPDQQPKPRPSDPEPDLVVPVCPWPAMSDSAEEPGPEPVLRNALSVVDTLELAKREFLFVGGCVMTDRPDLPLSVETSWTTDFSRVVAAIDDAIDQLVGADRRTPLGCTGCSTSQPIRRISARTKYVLAHLDSRTAAGDRS